LLQADDIMRRHMADAIACCLGGGGGLFHGEGIRTSRGLPAVERIAVGCLGAVAAVPASTRSGGHSLHHAFARESGRPCANGSRRDAAAGHPALANEAFAERDIE
jgi:hypothetical protein